MNILTDNLSFNTKGNCDIIDITDEAREFLQKSKLKNGNLAVFAVGSTASISTIEYEPGLKKDLPEILEKFIPSGKKYHHNSTWGDNNGHSHLRSTLFGCSQVIPFVNGELLLGTWQQIILIDFDERPRNRKVVFQLIGE
ncbi:MAG: secondary thiamine-phosphate synthase enzyme YjbQ [Ignavibacteria bacterium]|nr:secondary thiamine-phosphate synthase enzyme YjbQ [Ignavibacteria bacterium]